MSDSVTFSTHCHSRDLPRLHAPGMLESIIQSHDYTFDEIIVVHQRTGDTEYELPNNYTIKVLKISEEDYPVILGRVGIPHRDPVLSELCHGWDAAHYYEHHNVNHFCAALHATSDYIVFNDADCRMITHAHESWVTRGIQILQVIPEALIVAPSEGGKEFDRMLPDATRLTRTVSQQLFLVERKRFMEMNFRDLQWNGKFDAPYGPFQEWYGLLEGWMWRWMCKHGLYRAVLPEQWRYFNENWH